jgi:hypothetical protein
VDDRLAMADDFYRNALAGPSGVGRFAQPMLPTDAPMGDSGYGNMNDLGRAMVEDRAIARDAYNRREFDRIRALEERNIREGRDPNYRDPSMEWLRSLFGNIPK